jgi:hypothetical protein
MKIWKTSRIPFVALLLTAAITPIALAQATLADEPLKADISGTWIAKLASRMGELEIVYKLSMARFQGVKDCRLAIPRS